MKSALTISLLALSLSQAPAAIAQTKGTPLWPRLSKTQADCVIPGETTSLGKVKEPFPWIRQMDRCIVDSSILLTRNGARAQFITVTDFKKAGVEGYISFLNEVDCESMQTRMRYFWNLHVRKYEAVTPMRYDKDSGWWYFFRKSDWEEWKPIESLGASEAFLCNYRQPVRGVSLL